ncbi:protein of unknown function [Thauera humireducens]|uniref:hypothetical protein n=1 Tax=Thauera humireducens TaxID=1134435 RepID=UPI002467A1ED|nr:hypothetical protein [Thauera humireducens]CAH1748207.1 protein of unknown function [Thauera humireducens]
MPSPRSLTLALYTHWDVIESLVPLTRDFPAFDPDQALVSIGRVCPNLDLAQREDTLRQMVNADLLRMLPRGNALELHPQVLEFVRGLTREHELGLSQVLRARVDAIKGATAQLADALAHNQADGMRGAAIINPAIK